MDVSKRYWVHRYVDNDSDYYHPNSTLPTCECGYVLNTSCGQCSVQCCWKTGKHIVREESKRMWISFLLLMKHTPFNEFPQDILWCIYQFIQPSLDIATSCQSVTLPCEHSFHVHCIRYSASCHTCKLPIQRYSELPLHSRFGPPIVYHPHMRAINCYVSSSPFVAKMEDAPHRFALTFVVAQLNDTDMSYSELYEMYTKEIIICGRLSDLQFSDVIRNACETNTIMFDYKEQQYKVIAKRQKK